MKKGLLVAAIFAAAVLFALAARTGSPGTRMTAVLREYLDHLSTGDTAGAHALLTDSLGALILPDLLSELRESDDTGRIELVHRESRGFVAYLRMASGGSRTFWIVNQNGRWLISGETSLDNLLGRAASICRQYAESDAIPAVRNGAAAEEFTCPITGRAYFLRGGTSLVCASGHLGEGFDVSGDRCTALRDSLAQIVADYIAAGAAEPSSFEEMFQESQGFYGQRGGFRCPDHGYSYYRIENGEVMCPWHGEATTIPGTVR